MQLDILATGSDFGILPRHLPGRIDAAMFVNFIWPSQHDASRYTVAIEGLSVSAARFRSISQLQKSVELPFVQLGWDAKIIVLPDHPSLPAFHSIIGRGMTYEIPSVTKPGYHKMKAHGVFRPPGL